MIYFTLPNFFQNFQINNIINYLTVNYKDKLRNSNIKIIGVTGNFPHCSWNGDFNNNILQNMTVLYSDMINIEQTISFPIRLNCANVFLEDYDVYDAMSQTILTIFNNSNHQLEVSSISFMEKIQQFFPNYNFTFSKYADLILPFTSEILECLVDSGNFTLIGVPNKYSYDIDWLKSLKKKKYYEITVNPTCCFCDKYNECLLLEHCKQIEYSNQSMILSCEDIKNNSSIISIEDIENQYLPLGFSHFTFDVNYTDITENQIIFYIQYFFKDEYFNDLLLEAYSLL